MRRLDDCSRRAIRSSTAAVKYANAGGHKQLRTRRYQDPVGTREQLQGQQHQRHKQAVKIEQPDHAPGEIAGCHRSDGLHLGPSHAEFLRQSPSQTQRRDHCSGRAAVKFSTLAK